MSEQHRTKEEYIERHAKQYCDGDREAAAGHKIVQEVCKELKEDKNEFPRMTALEYITKIKNSKK